MKDFPGRQFVPAGIAFLVAVIACVAVLRSPHISDASANLVRGLIWPTFLVIVVLLFRSQTETLITILFKRIEFADKMVFGSTGISIEGRIPAPAKGEPVTLANLALLHTSFLREDQSRRRADGLVYYQIEVVVAAAKETLDRIASVTYRLDPHYPETMRRITNRASRFKLKELANGTAIIRAEIEFMGQEEPVYVNRLIDLRLDGPRI